MGTMVAVMKPPCGSNVLQEVCVKKCQLCRYKKVCKDLPFFCVIMQHAAVVALLGWLVYLFLNTAPT